MLETINNWRLAKKLLVAFASLGLLVGGLVINGFVSNHTLTAIAEQHVSQGVNSMAELTDLVSDIKERRIIVYSYYAAADAKDMKSLEERLAKNEKTLQEDLADYRKVAGDDFASEVSTLERLIQSLVQVDQSMFGLRRGNDLPGALKVIKGDGKNASQAAREQTEKLLRMSRERAEAANVQGHATSNTATLVTTLLSLLTLGGLAAIWLVIGRTVAAPMAELSHATETLANGGNAPVPHCERGDELGAIARAVEQFRASAAARAEADHRLAQEQAAVTRALRDSLAAMTAGDLTADIRASFPPAYEEIKANFNSALAALRDLIGSVMESTTSIRTGSAEIAQASEDLARRTESNAASLEETSAAVTQMDGRLKATADAAKQTVGRADDAINTVANGRSTADEAVGAMTRVAESAKGIDSVIEGLDKIAFQTRVLAMNAAVEAGRAGEAGRGFAVVADLVSALAMRSEEEASRAREQLTATQSDIVSAVEMVKKVDEALAEISGDVGEVHSLLDNIARDNQAQSSAISQVSVAIGTMDQSTQQNAAMVEETSAAARNLSNEVAQLAEQASRFRIGEAAPAAAARPSPAPRAAAPARAAANGSKPYVSPVKPLAMNGAAGNDDWTSF